MKRKEKLSLRKDLLSKYYEIDNKTAKVKLYYDTFSELINQNFGDEKVELINTTFIIHFDINDLKYNKKISFEIKCTKRWHSIVNGKPVVSTRWTNSTVQSSTENFVFIIFELNDIGLLTIENAYFGRLSYKEFKLKCKNGMRISENMVKELCVKII